MKKFIAIITATALLALSMTAFGLPIKREFRDMKLATQQLIEKQTISSPIAANVSNLVALDDGPDSAAAATITSFAASIDVPRNITLQGSSASWADIAGCTVTVNGTDFHGQTISEDFVVADDDSALKTGNKAFASLTSVSFPASCEEDTFGATWAIGSGEKLGLKRCLDQPGHVIQSTVGGVYEATRPTMASNESNIESNTADFNGTMDGSTDFEIFFMQNFRQECFP